MENEIKKKIAAGERVIGAFYELGGSAAAECMAIGGVDFFIVDTEHGPYDVESALVAITAAQKGGTTPFVRVKDHSRAAVMKMLDIGAKGIIVPCIETVAEVEDLVKYAKYFPLGNRGYAPTLAGNFGFADFAKNTETYFAVSNAETLLIPQCETLGCLENIETIAAMEGVDGIFVGPYDLSVAMGKPAQLDAPELVAAIKHIVAVCKANHKITMIYAGNPQGAIKQFENGFDAVACGMDAIMLINAVSQMVKEVREG